MKKRVAIPVIVSASVVAALLIAVLVLSLVSVNPLLKTIGDYNEVLVYRPDTVSPYPDSEKDGVKASDKVYEGMKGTKFSVMHAILEGRFSYSPKFKTVKNEDGKKERVKQDSVALLALRPDEKNYMLEFRYDDVHTMKVQGEEVKFDRLKIMIYETEGEIERIDVYPYEYAKVTTNNDDRLYYEIEVVQIWSNTSKLMSVLGDYESLL